MKNSFNPKLYYEALVANQYKPMPIIGKALINNQYQDIEMYDFSYSKNGQDIYRVCYRDYLKRRVHCFVRIQDLILY